MARQAITIGTADAKAGDTLNAAFTKINANETELYTNAASNAAAIVTNADAIAVNAAAIGGQSSTYWFITNSTNAAISHTGGATNTYLTNNANSLNAYNPNSKDVLWNPSTNKFDFTSLKVGDIVDIVGYASFNNLAAQEFDIFMSIAEGEASAHEHMVTHNYYKTAVTGNKIVFKYHCIIEDADELAGGARFRFASVQAAAITIERFSATVTVV